MTDDDEMFTFSCGPDTFPFHSDCYTWPRVAVYDEDGATELHVHCLCDANRREFRLVGFIGVDREEQISRVIFMAKHIGAEVIMFEGVGFNDDIIGGLMAGMQEPLPKECPGQKLSLMRTDWPTPFQYRVMREAHDMSRRRGRFHEEALAKRMKTSVEEIHWHLELLADLGLMGRV